MKNKDLNLFLKFAGIFTLLLILEIVFLIKIFNLDSSIYIPFMMLINMSVVYFFWWKNKGKREKESIRK
ncbi:MAG: hypothetical protein ACTIK4_11535 [Mesonia sp.]|uniref:hypothetical protein n=1 Tax=Mesonia sp. TaxID=1960830 RepID=UPI003F99C217